MLLPLLLRRGWLWLVLLLAARAGGAQPTEPVFRLARPRQRTAHLSFLTPRNLIVVTARLNGQGPYNFLLDTGVGMSMLTDPALAEQLHLTHGQDYGIRGVGGESSALRAYEAPGVRVELRGLVAPSMTWLVLSNDVLDLSGFAGMRIDGILGGELFKSLVVSIEPQQSSMTLYDPTYFKTPKGKHWTSLPLRIDHDKAYVTAEVEQEQTATASAEPLPLQLVLDTGAGHALSLETTADRRLQVPAAHLRTDLGRGLSGLVSGYLGRVAFVKLGAYRLPQVLTSFPDSMQVHQRLSTTERAARQGNLGYEMLKRFDLIIDYPHQRLLLRPTHLLHDPFEHDMCGLDLIAAGPRFRRYLVQRVVPASPADEAGIKTDEELVMVDFVPAENLDISSLNRVLHSQDGRVVFLVMRRTTGELYPVKVRLRRQI